MVRARVSNATSCRLELVKPHAVRVSFSRHWRQCSAGSFTERIRLRANPAHPSPRRVVFRLVARNRSAGLVTHRVVIHFRVRVRGASRLAKAATLDTHLSTPTLQSAIWAGYVATTTTPVSSVSATFVVPTVTCGSSTTWLATWVGVDGAESSGPGTTSLFQDGVDTYCIGGQQENQAWWESYPSSANPLGSVHAGDTISAAVWKTGGGWMWSVADKTTGVSYGSNQPVDYQGPAGTAEWIVEDPGSQSEPFVSAFSPITFSDMAMSPSHAPSGQIFQMVQAGRVLASPTTPTSAGGGTTMTVRSGG